MPSSISPPVLAALRRVEIGANFVCLGRHFLSLSSNCSYFVKHGLVSEAEQLEGEAESLRAMYAASPGICPRFFEYAVDEITHEPILISEYKSIVPLNYDMGGRLGEMLAEMHLKGVSPNGQFGFGIPTYCGNTRMGNGWAETWAATYDTKIGDLLDTLRETEAYEALCKSGDELREKAIPRLLGPLVIDPVILHGDLLKINAGSEAGSGNPFIYNPSSFYGHNEVDLSIARSSGGFPPSFFKAYHQKIPPAEPADEYDIRGVLYEVFHYLNHIASSGPLSAAMAYHRIGIVLGYVAPCSDPC